MPLGHTNNPNGRPVGSRNRRTEALWGDLEAKGDIDPAVHLSSIVSDPNQPAELRAAAANYLLPYKYSKRGPVLSLRYIEEPLQIPPPTSIAQARENIAFISNLKAQGRLDLDTADGLIADQKTAASILIEEAKLAAQGQGEGEQHIVISGGLPRMPGHEGLIMPGDAPARVNGHNGLPGDRCQCSAGV
jgi:hypothetical protein